VSQRKELYQGTRTQIEKEQKQQADQWEQTAGELVHTREYQLKLLSREWSNRFDQLNYMILRINKHADSLFELSVLNSTENVREQIYIDKTSSCGHRETIRIRNYVWGDQAQTSTIDNKLVSPEGVDLLDAFDLRPPESLKKTSIRKLEQDVHPCKSDKWSLELRLTDIPFQPVLSTCRDVQQYFPYLWISFGDKLESAVKMRKPEWWWQLSQHGKMADGTKWKSAFTLKYPSKDSAIGGVEEPLPRGEWSVRIYASNNGLGDWNPTTLIKFDHFYENLLNEFGSAEEWPCPPTS